MKGMDVVLQGDNRKVTIQTVKAGKIKHSNNALANI